MYYFKRIFDNYFNFNIVERCVNAYTNYFLLVLETKQSKLVSTMIASKVASDDVNNEVTIDNRKLQIKYKVDTSSYPEMTTNGSLLASLDGWSTTGSVTHAVGLGAKLEGFQSIGQQASSAPAQSTEYVIKFTTSDVVGTPTLFIAAFGGFITMTAVNGSYEITLSSSSSIVYSIAFSNSSASGSFYVRNLSVKRDSVDVFDGIEGNSEMTLKVYEQTSATNLNPKDVSVKGLRWQGLAILPEDSEVSYQQHPDPITRNYVYFKE